MLASQTGWTEDFIVWRLPMERVWGYILTYCRANGVKCRWARNVKSPGQTDADLKSLVNLLR